MILASSGLLDLLLLLDLLDALLRRGPMMGAQTWDAEENYNAEANHSEKLVVVLSHSSRPRARDIQLPWPWSFVKRRMGFSHFIHGLLEGLISRSDPDCLQSADHSASRHVVTRHTQLDGLIRITCPAHAHFLSACARTHWRTPAARAIVQALCVTLWTH